MTLPTVTQVEDVGTTYTQEQVDKAVEARLERERVEYAADRKLQADQAQQDSLAAEAKWKDLAEVLGTEVERLKPFEAQAQEYVAYLEAQLKGKVKGLSDVAKKAYGALPETMSTSDRLKWLAKSGLLQEADGGMGTPGRPKSKSGKKKPADVGHTQMRL